MLVQSCKRLGRFGNGAGELAANLAQHDAQDGALALERPPQALALLGVGVATGLAAQFLAFLDEGLLQGDAHDLGCLHHLAPGNLQQAAVHRMGNGLLLDRGVDDDQFELRWPHSLCLHGSVDGGLQQFFDVGFADGGAKAPQLGGIAGQPRP